MRPLFVLALSMAIAVSCSHSQGSNSGITVRIEPSQVTMRPGGSIPFTASVSGTTNLAVYWSVEEGNDGGTVGSDGVYLAPERSGVFHVTAASRADPTKTATASINVMDSSVVDSDAGATVVVDSGQTVANLDSDVANTARADTARADTTRADTARADTTVDSASEEDPIHLIGPLTFTHKFSPDPLPLIPPSDDPMPETNELGNFEIVPSRTTGVAPLYVFFETSKPLKAADGDVDLQATYIWTFQKHKDEPNDRYNRVSGFVAGHVFNLPGDYKVRVDVFDKNRKHGFQETIITVSAFSGKTYYVSTDGDDNNPGTKAQPFKTAKKAFGQIKPNTRILFHNDQEFVVGETGLDGDGPVIISGYNDDLTKPVTTMPTLHSNAVEAEWWILSLYGKDWRFVGGR
jgi:hypothetical protein